jgi:hypothetical protein
VQYEAVMSHCDSEQSADLVIGFIRTSPRRQTLRIPRTRRGINLA